MASCSKVEASQTLTVLSRLQVAILLPSGENAAALTFPLTFPV